MTPVKAVRALDPWLLAGSLAARPCRKPGLRQHPAAASAGLAAAAGVIMALPFIRWEDLTYLVT
jgi:hypothetical protein